MISLTSAIQRSRSHDERVTVDFRGDSSDLMVALDGITGADIDSADENDGTVDVWSLDGDWRLCVALV